MTKPDLKKDEPVVVARLEPRATTTADGRSAGEIRDLASAAYDLLAAV